MHLTSAKISTVNKELPLYTLYTPSDDDADALHCCADVIRRHCPAVISVTRLRAAQD